MRKDTPDDVAFVGTPSLSFSPFGLLLFMFAALCCVVPEAYDYKPNSGMVAFRSMVSRDELEKAEKR